MAKKKKVHAKTKHGPFLQVAAFCERVITENDNVRSLMRIIDTITVHSDKDELPPGTLVPTTVLGFKSGDVTGTYQLKIVAYDPSGDRLSETTAQIKFDGGNQGPFIQAEFPIPMKTTGLYWVHVYLNSRQLTQMPLEIRYTKVQPSLTDATSGVSKAAAKSRKHTSIRKKARKPKS